MRIGSCQLLSRTAAGCLQPPHLSKVATWPARVACIAPTACCCVVTAAAESAARACRDAALPKEITLLTRLTLLLLSAVTAAAASATCCLGLCRSRVPKVPDATDDNQSWMTITPHDDTLEGRLKSTAVTSSCLHQSACHAAFCATVAKQQQATKHCSHCRSYTAAELALPLVFHCGYSSMPKHMPKHNSTLLT